MSNLSKSVIITGVSGFLGRYIARNFHKEGWKIIGIDSSPFENAPTSNLEKYYRLNLPDSKINLLLEEYSPQLLIHCAGRASVGLSVTHPAADFYGNTVLTFEILNAIRLHSPNCKFIFLSSAAVYGEPMSLPITENCFTNPISPYGFHKLQCEEICSEFTKIYGIATASLRIFSAYGPGLRRQVLWDICHKSIVNNNLELQGTGNESRDFIHAVDIANAVQIIANKAPMKGECYNLANGEETTISELANLIIEALEIDITPQFDCIVPKGNPHKWRADISKLKDLGFNPSVPFDVGIKTLVTWCKAELLGY